MSRVVDISMTVGRTVTGSASVTDVFQIMSDNAIDHAVLGLGERWLAFDCDAGNQYLVSLVKESPEKLSGYATTNPWAGPDGLQSVERALDAGLAAIKVDPLRQGFTLMESVANPLWKLAESRGVPVYVVTGTLNSSMPFQLAEVARRYPTVHFIMGRSGRTDMAGDVIPAAHQASNILLETVYNPPLVVGQFIQEFGDSRILFASDAPRAAVPLEVSKLNQVPNWSSHSARVMGENASHLFDLE